MASLDWRGMLNSLFQLALLAGAIFYITLVILSYFEDRTHARPQFDFRDPAHSVEHLAVWVGVAALALSVRVVAPVFAMLSEASAQVGDWLLNGRHHPTP